MQRTVHVDLGPRSYDVRIGAGLVGEIGQSAADLDAKRAAVISETNVAPLYAKQVLDSLSSAGLDAWDIVFQAGEPSKTLGVASEILDELLGHEPPIDRRTMIIALGGGVAGDMAGFVAATALRGLRWLQCPTSLLADVDASTGGKTGVDHPVGKNLIGAFHQPAGVLIDVETLKTLPREELTNGLAECVKHAVIRDASMLDFLERNVEGILGNDPDVMTELIAINVAIKAAVVTADELESGQRAHLNFGHTVGHAIETSVGYENIRHGEAIGLGMIAENRLATGRGMIPDQEASRVERVLASLGLPVHRAGLDAGEIWKIMQHDKKALDGRVRIVLASAIGDVDIYDDVTEDEVKSVVESLGN
jgi:3-dehydroquinate synthase